MYVLAAVLRVVVVVTQQTKGNESLPRENLSDREFGTGTPFVTLPICWNNPSCAERDRSADSRKIVADCSVTNPKSHPSPASPLTRDTGDIKAL